MHKNLCERRMRIRQTLKNYFTPLSALHASEFGLLTLGDGDITKNDAENIIQAAAKLILSSEFLTAAETEASPQQKSKWLSTGCEKLDTFLGGGFSLKGVTEIAGSSGCGKTQLCLQLLMTAQYPENYGGLKAGAVYICTEDSFPSQRLQQLIQTFPSNKCNPSRFGDNIFIEHIAEVDQLQHCLKDRLPCLILKRRIGLVIIDSVAGVFRSSYNLENCQERAEKLRIIGGQLHYLSHKHNICVICINQVTGDLKSSTNSSAPALGLAWANLVTTRLFMSRTDPTNNVIVRSLEVVFSPYLPNKSINFAVEEDGVKGIV